ncbi:hypothetical protein [Paenibacillus thermotolerans]|uniref:hypothetical protein n=1 Tax=Paenibacillus thermotolerans TaxID=3027807 RepID=UPI0023683126|nr:MULTISPECIES: hypothetical protein [unclassified Paenibacillus]
MMGADVQSALKELFADTLQEMLEAELDHELGHCLLIVIFNESFHLILAELRSYCAHPSNPTFPSSLIDRLEKYTQFILQTLEKGNNIK